MNLDTKIQENNLLVRVRMTKFGNTKRDKSISNEVTESKGAKDKLIRVNKTLFDSPVIKSLNSNQGQIRNHTIPDHGALWDGDGWYIQGVAMFDKFDSEMKRKITKQNDLKAELRKTYPDILDRARRDLGAAFDINDYPTVDEVVDSYSIKVEKNKIPDSDIKLNLPKAALDKMKADIEASVTERVENATRSVHDRVVDALSMAWNATVRRLPELRGPASSPTILCRSLPTLPVLCRISTSLVILSLPKLPTIC